MVANQRRNLDLVQPINIIKKERLLQVMGWEFVIAAGAGTLWAVITWTLGP